MYWSSISITIWFSVCLEVSCVLVVVYYTDLLFRAPLTFTDNKYDYMHYAYGFCNVEIMAMVKSRSDLHIKTQFIMYAEFWGIWVLPVSGSRTWARQLGKDNTQWIPDACLHRISLRTVIALMQLWSILCDSNFYPYHLQRVKTLNFMNGCNYSYKLYLTCSSQIILNLHVPVLTT